MHASIRDIGLAAWKRDEMAGSATSRETLHHGFDACVANGARRRRSTKRRKGRAFPLERINNSTPCIVEGCGKFADDGNPNSRTARGPFASPRRSSVFATPTVFRCAVFHVHLLFHEALVGSLPTAPGAEARVPFPWGRDGRSPDGTGFTNQV